MDGMPSYDALLLLSFGGPEAPEDVVPFLENVTRGRGVPAARLEQAAQHYYLFGGVSPTNQQCRDLVAAIEKNFAASGIDLPVYWGNRNWRPYLADTVATMAGDGVRSALAFVTAAYSSFSSCRQYLGDIARARAMLGDGAPRIDKLRHYFNHPGFIEPFADATATAIASLPAAAASDVDLVFTAHSIPAAMAAASGPAGGAYQAQLAEASRLIAGRVQARSWRLAYQSRSGPPAQPWLGPDVSDCLGELARSGSRAVVLVPVGFVSDHLEVRYDLDIEAAATAAELGLALARAATPGTDSRFTAMVTELVRERLEGLEPRALGSLWPAADSCTGACCGGPGGTLGRAGAAGPGAASRPAGSAGVTR
jgi:protoporphyrin/coproporphyrin ferrochelatase